VGTPFTQWHEIWSQNTRDSKLSYGKTRSLYLTWAAIGTGLCQTDTKTELANARVKKNWHRYRYLDGTWTIFTHILC